MGVLIDSLMVLARMDSGAESLSYSTVDVVSIGREASAAIQPLADSKQIQFDREIPEEPLLVDGDPHALRRLFLILIDNAVKYTPTGGQVSINIKALGSDAVAQIRDTGIGITREDL